MYTLILTVALLAQNNYRDSAVAITHIDGFKSHEACLAAGDEWLKRQKKDATLTITREAQALCIRKE